MLSEGMSLLMEMVHCEEVLQWMAGTIVELLKQNRDGLSNYSVIANSAASSNCSSSSRSSNSSINNNSNMMTKTHSFAVREDCSAILMDLLLIVKLLPSLVVMGQQQLSGQQELMIYSLMELLMVLIDMPYAGEELMIMRCLVKMSDRLLLLM